MKAISQHPVAAREQRGHSNALLARSRSRELHCWSLLSLSCLCLTSFRRSARRLRACFPRGPKSSLSSLLASSRKSCERTVMLTQDSSQRSPSESSPSHSMTSIITTYYYSGNRNRAAYHGGIYIAFARLRFLRDRSAPPRAEDSAGGRRRRRRITSTS